MKTSGRIMICCTAVFLALTSVSAVQRLNSIRDLKEIYFDQSVPEHSLMLLHWFANTMEIDHYDVIRLTFNPNRGDYGSHHYRNDEELLDPLPWGYQYYTIGNLNQDSATSLQLPPHVVYLRPEYEGNNRDRIIIRVNDSQIIDQVYITQHYFGHQGSEYDPAHTYQVTVNLLRQIREFPIGGNLQLLRNLRGRFGGNISNSQLSDIRNTWGDLACLGLLMFIVTKNYSSNKKMNNPQPAAGRNTQQSDFAVDIPESRSYDDAGSDSSNCVWVCLVPLVIVLIVSVIIYFAIVKNQK